MLEELLPEEDRKKRKLPEGATYGDALAFELVKRAAMGEVNSARELREAVEGKARQRVELQLNRKVNFAEIISQARKRADSAGNS